MQHFHSSLPCKKNHFHLRTCMHGPSWHTPCIAEHGVDAAMAIGRSRTPRLKAALRMTVQSVITGGGIDGRLKRTTFPVSKTSMQAFNATHSYCHWNERRGQARRTKGGRIPLKEFSRYF